MRVQPRSVAAVAVVRVMRESCARHGGAGESWALAHLGTVCIWIVAAEIEGVVLGAKRRGSSNAWMSSIRGESWVSHGRVTGESWAGVLR